MLNVVDRSVGHLRGRRSATVAACCALLASGCGDSTGGRPGLPGELTGAFTLRLEEAGPTQGPRAVVVGKAYAGPVPEPVPLGIVRELGDCQLLEPRLPFCDPPCGSGAQCSAGDVCVAYPRAVDLGVVSVSGLSLPVSLTTTPPSYNYQSDPLPYSPCAEGAKVTLTSAAFSLSTGCVSPLLVVQEPSLLVRHGQPLELSWTPPSRADLAHISVRLDIAHHGGQAAQIACVVDDTGAFAIPAALIDELLDRGVAGFPSVILSRETSTNDPKNPQLTFSLRSTIERPVDAGVTSCLSSDACPPGSVCDTTTLVCRQI